MTYIEHKEEKPTQQELEKIVRSYGLTPIGFWSDETGCGITSVELMKGSMAVPRASVSWTCNWLTISVA